MPAIREKKIIKPGPRKLKILKGVPTLLAANKRMLRTISAYYVLKSLYKSSIIQDVTMRMDELAEECRCSPRTLYTRIKEMQRLGLCKRTGANLVMCSYDELHKVLGCEDDTMNFHFKKYTAKAELIMRTLAIKENFSRQEKQIKKKLEKRMQSSGLSPEQIARAKEAAMNRLISAFTLSVPLSPEDQLIHPDIALSQESLAKLFGLKNAYSGAYWQQKLVKAHLIAIENRKIESSKRCRGTPLGHVFYSRRTQTTVCQMPNKTVFL
jgi:hypothetical protein